MGIIAAMAGFFIGWLLIQASRRISISALRWAAYALSWVLGFAATVLITRSDDEARQAGSAMFFLLVIYPIGKHLFVRSRTPANEQP